MEHERASMPWPAITTPDFNEPVTPAVAAKPGQLKPVKTLLAVTRQTRALGHPMRGCKTTIRLGPRFDPYRLPRNLAR